MNREDIAAWVKKARECKGWTQQQLAEELHLTKANVSHWETLKHDPSFLQLLRIRDLTGYPLREVMPPEAWPFPTVGREQITSLAPEQRTMVEAGLQVALASARAAAASAPAPTKRTGTDG